jgi:adenine-specific DNA-methyltransferase
MTPTPGIIDTINSLPTTRYQGSKRKLLPWIYGVLREIEFETVLDAFGGTASVSYLFKRMNKKVTYNDILKFNYHIGKSIIENKNDTLTQEDIQAILSQRKMDVKFNFIEKTFDGYYYTNTENKWLDSVTKNILNMNHYSGCQLENKISLAYFALIQACLIKRPFNLFHRKNLNIRTMDVPRSFGNKTTWDTSFEFFFKKFAGEANTAVFNSGVDCLSLNKSAFEIDGEYDLVYLDPPYYRHAGGNETSNYTKIYHFLEGLVSYNNWDDLIDYRTINRRMKTGIHDDELDIRNIKNKFEQLVHNFYKSKIVISYKYGGVPSIDWIIKLLKKNNKSVYTHSKHYKYALNHQNGDAKKNREVLIVGI